MINALSRSRAVVENDTEALLSDPLISRQLGSYIMNLPDKLLIPLLQIEESLYVFARDDQDMNRCLGVGVPKRDDELVLVNDIPFDISFDNATKKTFVHFTPFRRTPVRLRMDLDSAENPLASPLVILSPSLSVILSGAKDLDLTLRTGSAKNLVFSKT